MSTAVVKWNKATSIPFQINNGVKQGGIISAPLFAMYFDPLLNLFPTEFLAYKKKCTPIPRNRDFVYNSRKRRIYKK